MLIGNIKYNMVVFVSKLHIPIDRYFSIGNQRSGGLEGLRGFAAFIVIIHHYVNWIVQNIYPHSMAYGFLQLTGHLGSSGVALFFTISGYLIHSISMERPQPYFEFIKKRLRRIYPLAFFCITFALIGKLALGQLFIPVITGVKWLDILCNYLFVPGVFPAPALYTVTWTLSYEMLFYITCPFIALLFKQLNFTSTAKIFFCFFISTLILLFLREQNIICFFIIGILVYETVSHLKFSIKFKAPLDAVGLLAGTSVFIYWQLCLAKVLPYPLPADRIGIDIQKILFFGFGVYVISSAAIGTSGYVASFFSRSIFRFLGNISYSLYLTHIFVLTGLMHFFPYKDHQYISDFYFFIYLLIFITLAIMFAAGTFLVIERPLSLDGKWPWQAGRSEYIVSRKQMSEA